ncbi:MAG: hypothetical protein ABII82_04990 [Verrucomicrobiota bacterium]
MSDASRIRINALLLQREELFVRVHDIERSVNDLLGEPWPFEPPSLPSIRRPKAKPAKKRAASAPAKGARPAVDEPKLRKLDESSGETAYRVTYLQRGQTREETHDTPEALQTLLAAQGEQLRVLAIDAVDAHGEPLARIYPTDTA